MDWGKIDDTDVFMHLYRGELQRINTWRARMDRTTNWSIVITVGVLTWVFANPQRPHWIILPGLALVYAFLFTEARRYRHYDMWRGRVRLLEERFLARYFDRRIEEKEGWEHVLADDLRDPQFKITWQEAVKRRLKRIYVWIILIYTISWIAKIYSSPTVAKSWGEFCSRTNALDGTVPGAVILFIILGIIIGSIIYFFVASPKREAKGKPVTKKVEKEKFGTEEYIEELEGKIEEDEEIIEDLRDDDTNEEIV